MAEQTGVPAIVLLTGHMVWSVAAPGGPAALETRRGTVVAAGGVLSGAVGLRRWLVRAYLKAAGWPVEFLGWRGPDGAFYSWEQVDAYRKSRKAAKRLESRAWRHRRRGRRGVPCEGVHDGVGGQAAGRQRADGADLV